VRVALRNQLQKEPLNEDFTKFAEELNSAEYLTLAKELKRDVDGAFCKGDEVYVLRIPPCPESNCSAMDQVIALWGMKCVGYDFTFEKHLANSIREIKPQGASKRKAVASDDDAVSEGKDE